MHHRGAGGLLLLWWGSHCPCIPPLLLLQVDVAWCVAFLLGADPHHGCEKVSAMAAFTLETF